MINLKLVDQVIYLVLSKQCNPHTGITFTQSAWALRLTAMGLFSKYSENWRSGYE